MKNKILHCDILEEFSNTLYGVCGAEKVNDIDIVYLLVLIQPILWGISLTTNLPVIVSNNSSI